MTRLIVLSEKYCWSLGFPKRNHSSNKTVAGASRGYPTSASTPLPPLLLTYDPLLSPISASRPPDFKWRCDWVSIPTSQETQTVFQPWVRIGIVSWQGNSEGISKYMMQPVFAAMAFLHPVLSDSDLPSQTIRASLFLDMFHLLCLGRMIYYREMTLEKGEDNIKIGFFQVPGVMMLNFKMTKLPINDTNEDGETDTET
ncbi:hypothetical protein LXL04_034943 [Taraxacum kok-saghyz]